MLNFVENWCECESIEDCKLVLQELGEKKEPWYRVWLGYFPDAESAKAGGEVLQQRGEVKSYLVRKSENQEDSAN